MALRLAFTGLSVLAVGPATGDIHEPPPEDIPCEVFEECTPTPTLTPTRNPTPQPSCSTLAPGAVLCDDFNKNSIDRSRWTTSLTGAPTLSATSGRVETSIPQTATNFGAYLRSNGCTLRGDFDVQVDFDLLDWPAGSGARAGLYVYESSASACEVRRVSYSDGEFPETTAREVYTTWYLDRQGDIVPTSDRHGKLRLVRVGNLMTAYYLSDSGWATVGACPPTSSDVGFAFGSWSWNDLFAHRAARVGFDNFIVSQGELVCPSGHIVAASVPEFSGEQGQNNWYYGYVAPATGPDFIPMPQFAGDWFVDRTRYWTVINTAGGHPNGMIGGKTPIEHWAVRRWVSEVSGNITIYISLAKADTGGGNGIEGRVVIGGTTVFSKVIAFNDSLGIDTAISANVKLGSTVDFVIDPLDSNDLYDETRFTAIITTESAPPPPSCGTLAPEAAFCDDFNDNSINSESWTVWIDGSGPTIEEKNQRLEVASPADPLPSATGTFGALCGGVCQLQGDFDMQVDFQMLEAPLLSGVRVGMLVSDRPTPPGITGPGTISVTRSSRIQFHPNDVYELYSGTAGTTNEAPTSDLSGRVRLVRTGDTLIGYYFSNGAWMLLGPGFPVPASILYFYTGSFSGRSIRVALDNFIIINQGNQGRLVCPATPTPTPTASPTAQVTPPCVPNCSGRCGNASDGCGGTCASQPCGENQVCSNDVCVSRAPVIYQEPVEMMELSGNNPYAAFNSLPTERPNEYHTGMDVKSHNHAPNDRTTPVYPAADGRIEAMFRTPDTDTRCDNMTPFTADVMNRNLGNVVIIRHPHGRFSLYGHLDCVDAGVDPGVEVVGGTAGTRLGIMGNSGPGNIRRNDTAVYGVHLHFEIKDIGKLGDRWDTQFNVGYVPDIPDGYGYRAPDTFLSPFSETEITPVVFAVAANEVIIRSGPGTMYSKLGYAQQNQHLVARARNGDWLKVDVPNAAGRVSGWGARVFGGETLLAEIPNAMQVRVVNTGVDGLFIRTEARATGDTTHVLTPASTVGVPPTRLTRLKVWDDQRFSVRDRAETGGVTWYEIDVPASVGARTSGWISGEFAESGKPRLAYYALGDSIAAGHGLPSGYGRAQGTCRVSPDAYPGIVASRLSKESGFEVAFPTPLACTGARSYSYAEAAPNFDPDDLPSQFGRLLISKASQPVQHVVLVTMTFGADDLEFVNEAQFGTHLCATDRAFRQWVEGRAATISKNLMRAASMILDDPRAVVVLTGYYNPFNPQSGYFKLLESQARADSCRLVYSDACPFFPDSALCHECRSLNSLCPYFSDRALFNRTERVMFLLNGAVAEVVASVRADPKKAQRIGFVDVAGPFKDHRSPRPYCGDADPPVGETFVQYPLFPIRQLVSLLAYDALNGNLELDTFAPFAERLYVGDDCFHPNILGASTYAGVPSIHFGGALGTVYSPTQVTIAVGDTVEWQGDFSSHPLVSDDGLWPTHSTGMVFDFAFTTPGTFRFHCQVHGGPNGIGMAGEVIALPNRVSRGVFDVATELLSHLTSESRRAAASLAPLQVDQHPWSVRATATEESPVAECCESHAGPGCELEACAVCVCQSDSFCCDASWDVFCSDMATGECASTCLCGPPRPTEAPAPTPTPGGDCCVGHEGAACDNTDCRGCVCSLDASCCDEQWDDFCAVRATVDCDSSCACPTPVPTNTPLPTATATDTPTGTPPTGTPTPTPGGHCCVAHEGAQCGNCACQTCVCAADGFCCSTAWDEFCVRSASNTCAPECGCPTLTPVATATPTLYLGGTATPTAPTPVQSSCVGDCDGGGRVTVNEIVTMVNIALGNRPLSACMPADADGSGTVKINEIIAAVNKALSGC